MTKQTAGRTFAIGCALTSALIALAGCEGGGSAAAMKLCGDAYTPEGGLAAGANFTGTAGIRINAMLGASTAVVNAAKKIDADLLVTCQSIATDLMVPATATAPVGTETPTQATCRAAAAEVKTIIEQNVPTGAKLTIVAELPRCEVDASLTNTCVTMCEEKTITETVTQCKPGKLSGSCSGMCSGSCTLAANASCTGSCTAECTGTCSGRCTGQCMGDCTLKNAAGECVGACRGECKGSCDAECSGTCSGSCTATAQASCMGTCRGGCSVAFVAPKCEEVEVMSTVQECQTSCDAQARASAVCTPGQVVVDFRADITPAQKAKLDLLLATMRKNLPKIYLVAHQSATLVGDTFKNLGSSFLSVQLDAGAQALACVTVAGGAIGKSAGNIIDAAKSGGDVVAAATAEGKVAVQNLCGTNYTVDGGVKGTFTPKVAALLTTSSTLAKAVKEMNADLAATCTAMATELGIPKGDLTVPTGQSATKVICGRVKQEIDLIIALNLPKAAKLTVVAAPAVCEVSAMAQITCTEMCEMKTVTATEIQCAPGKASGTCSGMCSGSCTVGASVSCTGSCAAECTGTCSGTCAGTCMGTCSAMNAAGECIGTCTGTCKGTCDATCTGMCSGSCTAQAQASCMGSCRGSCSVAFVAPKCEEIQVMREVNECTTSCDASARASAMCTPPSVTVAFTSDLTPAKAAKLKLLVTVLKKHLPKVLSIAYRAGTVVKASAESFSTSLGAFVKTGLAGLTAEIGSCLGIAGEAVFTAVGDVKIVGEASASISVSVAANGGV